MLKIGMEILYLILAATFDRGFAISNKLNLSIPNQARASDKIWATCSANVAPFDEIAEFLINGVTSDSIIRHSTGCFSAIRKIACSRHTCKCSRDGKQYSTRLNINHLRGDVNITCSMNVNADTVSSKTRIISIEVTTIESSTSNIHSSSSSTLDNEYTFTEHKISDIFNDQITTKVQQSSNKVNKSRKNEIVSLNHYGFVWGGLILGLCLVFASIILTFSKCRTVELKPNIHGSRSNVSHQFTNRSQTNVDLSEHNSLQDYESINESDLLHEVRNVINLGENNVTNINNIISSGSTSKIDPLSSDINSSVSSNNSYLEVIADIDYINPYQMIKDDINDQHTYCVASMNTIPYMYITETIELCSVLYASNDTEQGSPSKNGTADVSETGHTFFIKPNQINEESVLMYLEDGDHACDHDHNCDMKQDNTLNGSETNLQERLNFQRITSLTPKTL